MVPAVVGAGGNTALDMAGVTLPAIPAIGHRVSTTFPDDAACAAYLEKARWGGGFACPHCGVAGEPFRIATRPGVMRQPRGGRRVHADHPPRLQQHEELAQWHPPWREPKASTSLPQ